MDDPSSRWFRGVKGVIVRNDFPEKYDYLICLEFTRDPMTSHFYFNEDEVEPVG